MALPTQPSANAVDRTVDLASYHLLTSDEAADILSVPVATLRTWRTRRRGYGPPAVHLGGNIRYRPEDLVTWIEEHTESETGCLRSDAGAQSPRLTRRRRPHVRSLTAPDSDSPAH
ncbi:helix-turn-helix domain-containing protein [Nocardioides terrisoli]|uniref:helix-turn-helix domain-containing protein n=1 Tax=Nocardioides terrisoli TaxID=3388267 RepID=UPI00287B6AE8|nr:helix-turn-helix domain-containing protein [Nocardioides marmorisolisilvae]